MKDEIKKDKVERQVRREIEIQQNLRWVARYAGQPL